jgi:signal transduction histidine kinase
LTTADLSNDLPALIAARIRDAQDDLAQRWLDRLVALLPVEANEIFPSAEVLDHIPALIQEIASYIGAAESAAAANTVFLSKATELGELRFAQRASVHQLLREYRILGAVIDHFVEEELTAVAKNATPAGAVHVLSRLHEAIFVLLQMTVDTFVGRYSEKIDEQTTRLEGFNRMVSHELRQPLSSVQYAVELLAVGGDGDPARRTHLLDVAGRNVRRLASLVRMLGTLARPEQDTPSLQRVDLSKVVAESIPQLRDLADAKGVAVNNRVDPIEVTIDVARLELILINLLSNGVKYRDPKKSDPFVEVTFTATESGYALSVRDNGLGIPESERAGVFRRYARAHAQLDGVLENDGIGLGLAIVAECVKGMRGTITVESEVGAGTSFVVTLPGDTVS